MSVSINRVLKSAGIRVLLDSLAIWSGASVSRAITHLLSLFAALLLALLGLLTAPAQAQTVVSGTISSNVTWRAAASPYVVTGDVLINNNAIVTIEAGTQIFMAGNTSITVNSGAIRANGSANAPVVVQSDKVRTGQAAAAGDWNRWVFNASNSELHYVQFAHGKGLQVNAAALTINHSQIRNMQGAAITQDLASSLTGSGNSASGNTSNAIAVPAGDISGNVRWQLKGIPYLIASGTVSVGASPQITILNPSVMQAGETITSTVTGVRLQGVSAVKFSDPGVTATILSGASNTQVALQITAQAGINAETTLSMLTDAGWVSKTAALTVSRPQPKITSINPNTIYTNRGETVITLTGSNFVADSVALLDDATITSSWQSATQMQVTVPNQINPGTRIIKLRTPDPVRPGNFLDSNPVSLIVNAPQAALDVATVSMIDGTNKSVTLSLPFAAPAGGLSFSLASANSLVASVPGTVTVLEGQKTVSFTVQAASVGSTTITISRAAWNNTVLPVTVIEPPRVLALTPITSSLIGVLVGSANTNPTDAQSYGPINAARVGVLVGAAVGQVAPRAGVVGTTTTVTITGVGLNSVTAVSVLPADGISIAAPVASGDGKQLTVAITVDANAVKGGRRLTLRSATGVLSFMNLDDAQFLIAAPSPEIFVITPQVIVAGQAPTKLTLRGRNLRDILSVRFVPNEGLAAVGNIVTNAEGTQLEVNVQADANAVSGSRVMVLQAAGGVSTEVASPANTLQVARQIGPRLDSITAPIVGVQVGPVSPASTLDLGPIIAPAVGVMVGGVPPNPGQNIGPVAATPVGVVVGTAAVQMAPKAGVIGTQVNMVVTGRGLTAVTALEMSPAAGLTISNLSVNADGSSLSFTLNIAADAAKTLRSLILKTATGRMQFSNQNEAFFLVAAPAPVLDSIAPQVLIAGQANSVLTVRGNNLRDISGVRFVPADGVSVLGSASSDADGKLMQITVQVSADAVSGLRTMIITTAGGESSSVPVAANSLQVARQVGATLPAISSSLVGVMVGAASQNASDTRNATAQVGVVVGAVANALQPAGAVKGASGQLRISGVGLTRFAGGAVSLFNTAVANNGISLGSVTVNAQGTELTVPYSVAANAPSAQYKLVLGSGNGGGTNALLFAPAAQSLFTVIDEPAISSITPTVMQRGKAYQITVRGSKLQNVRSLSIEDSNGPVPGLTWEANGLSFGTDGLGDKLTVRVVVDAATPLGAVVLRLNHAGGASSAAANTANTINIVNP